MSGTIATFLERLAERLTALVAGSVSARLAGVQAALQAEEQSRLEDLARQYEADGKSEIAATLRARAARLTAPDLAGEAADVIELVSREPAPPALLLTDPPPAKVRTLPNRTAPPAKPSRHPSLTRSAPATESHSSESQP